MFDFNQLYSRLHDTRLQNWAEQLPAQIQQQLDKKRHGDLEKWQAVLALLPA